MTLSEDQLRTEIHDSLSAAAAHLPAIDAADVVDAGARIVRRRRIAAVSATTAVAAVVAVALGTMLGGGQARKERPGTPTSKVSVDASATLTLSGSRVADGTDAREFVVRIGPRAVPPAKAVTMIPPGNVGYYAKGAGGSLDYLGGSTTDGLGRHSTLGYGGGDVVLGLVPDDAVAVGLIPGHDGDTGGYSQDGPRRIAGTGYSAIAFRLDKVPSSATTDFQVMWWRADGTPVTNDATGSAVQFTTDQGAYGMWAIPTSGLVGYSSPAGGGTTMLSNLYTDGVGDFDATRDYVEDGTKTPSTMRGNLVHLYAVPGRVTGVRGTYSTKLQAATPIQVRYFPAIDATVVLAGGRLPETPGAPGSLPAVLTRLTWTDAGGAPQSHDFR